MKTSTAVHVDLNDIIFDDRNKAYGAYHIRKEYDKTVWKAFAIATLAFVGIVALIFFLQRVAPNMTSALPEMINVQEVDIIPATPDEPDAAQKEPDAAKPAEQPKGMDTQKFDQVKPVADANPAATMAADSLFKDKQPGLTTTDSLGNGAIGGDPKGTGKDPVVDGVPNGTGTGTKTPPSEPDQFEVHLGTMPVPTNLDDIKKAIGYPAEARDLHLEGRVDFRVLVDENGHYVRHVTLRRTNPIFEEACAKELKNIQFQAGKMGDRPVKVWVMIPFKFSLSR